MSLGELASALGGVLFVIGILLIVAGWLFFAIRRIVCGKQHRCTKEDCPLRARSVCGWVDPHLEAYRIKKLIAELEEKNRQEKRNSDSQKTEDC